jgi:hypothetical protein
VTALQKGVPIPPAQPKRTSKYPFTSMKVNDSFFTTGAMAASVQHLARRSTKHLGWNFTSRAVTENGQRGVRCWRTA